MGSEREHAGLDVRFYAALNRTGLITLAVLAGGALFAWLLNWPRISDFLVGMELGTFLIWFSLGRWAKAYFGAEDRETGIRRMLFAFVLGLPLGILVAYGVVSLWPRGALGFGFGVCTPVFYAIWPAWMLRNWEDGPGEIP